MMPTGLPMPATPPPAPAAANASNASARNTQASDRDSKPFAGMLDEATPSETPAAAETAAASAEADSAPADDKPTTDEADAALPDQLLALLGGAWSVAPTSAAAPKPGVNAAGGDLLLSGSAAPTLPSLNLPTLPGVPTATAAATGPNVMASAANGNPGFALPGLLASSETNAAAQPNAAALAALSAFAPGLETRADTAGEALANAGREIGIDNLNFPLPATTTPTLALTPRAVVMLDAVMLPPDADAGFGDDLGARIGWMVDQKLGEAQIRVHPEHVGPIDVRVQLDGQRVSAEFNSTNADVRQALESGLGRLRDMLNQQGLQLAHAGVGDGQREGQGSSQGSADTTAAGTPAEDAPRLRASRGLLDEYA